MNPRTCRDCGKTMFSYRPGLRRAVIHTARGLCKLCYDLHRHGGTLDEHPRATRARCELLEEAEFLRSAGASRDETAARLGVRWESIERARYRQRAAERVAS